MPETLTRPRIAAKSLEKLQDIEDNLRTEREPFRTFWSMIAAKLNPMQSDFFEDTPPSTKRPPDMKDNYDNTAQKASDILANGLQSAAFGRGVPWIQTVAEDQDRAKDKGAKDFMSKCDLALARQFSRTSFYDEARSFTRSCADLGTGIMFREHNAAKGMPVYHTQHLKRCLIAEDEFGQVDTLFRSFWLAPWEAVEQFGLDNLPKDIVDAYRSGDTKKYKFIQYIFPRDKYDMDTGARVNAKPFYSLFVADVDRKHPVREGGYDYQPFFAWRWARSMEGDVWGVDSPGMIEYSNVLQANATKKDFSRLVQLAARPPIKATEGLEGSIRLEPNAQHFMRPGQDFMPVQVAGDLQGVLADLQQLRTSIQESYYVNFFLALQANMERVKTATEVAGIKGEQAAQLAAMTGRLYYEFLEPAVEDLFSLEMTYGRLPPVPDVLKGQKLRIDLVSPLAQLQKRYMMLNESDEFMGRIVQISQVNPTVMYAVDIDSYVQNIADAFHVAPGIVRDLADVQKMRIGRAQQQEAMQVEQMKNEKAAAEAKVMQAGSRAPEAGSPVEQMMNQKGRA